MEEAANLLKGAAYINQATIDAYMAQSAPYSCGVATLAIMLGNDTTELAAFEYLCEAFTGFTLADSTAFPRLAPLQGEGFDPRQSSLWVPSVLDLPNFAVGVRAAGREDAQPVVSYGFGAGFESEDSIEEACNRFRADLARLSSGTAIALSFGREAAGQTGGGHWSPVSAFNCLLYTSTSPRDS